MLCFGSEFGGIRTESPLHVLSPQRMGRKMFACVRARACVCVCVPLCLHCCLSVPESTAPSLFACWIIEVVFDVLPMNQSQLSHKQSDSHKITCESIYTCQRFDLQLRPYTKCIIKLSNS